MSRLDSGDRRTLLEIARRAITQGVAARKNLELDAPTGALSEPACAFVTLRRDRQLRGCIGRLASNEPLAQVVAYAARSAALEDPRFEPVRGEEVAALEIEISVLSPFEEVTAVQVIAGTHGLMVQRGLFRGLLLPQVATEYHWNAQRFLEETCTKAGLPRDAWRDRETRLFAFTAEIFSERDFAGIKNGAESRSAPQ